jgi:fumarylpyruvate hydrolase
MEEFPFNPPKQPFLPIRNGMIFPIRRIFAVGQNYADHAKEMGSNLNRHTPFFFHKPSDGLTHDNKIIYPPATQRLDHEVELVVALCREGKDIPVSEALDYVYGYSVGCDLTRRDMQSIAKQSGKPWDMAKAFDNSAVSSAIETVEKIGHPQKGFIRLSVNGKVRQSGDLSQLLWTVPEIISEISKLVTVKAGDLIYTGTPAGIGTLYLGDEVFMEIENVGQHSFKVV